MRTAHTDRTAGFSIVGMLVTLVCMVILFSILMTSMNKAVTGQGSQQAGTVRSFQDELFLQEFYKGMLTYAGDSKGWYPVPSRVSGSKDTAEDTTANLFSVMVMGQYAMAKQLISGNEYSGYVEEMMNYDMSAYNPTKRVFWDSNFKADLQRLSHTSFAHEPLCGQRLERQWNNNMSSTFPLVGNRGPKDGMNSTTSFACGKNGIWGGHMVFGDGHVVFTHDPAGNGLAYEQSGQRLSDNIFKMETGGPGSDAVLSFTKVMNKNAAELQWD